MKLRGAASSLQQKVQAHKVVLVIVGVSILLVGGYMFWSKLTWDAYERNSAQWHGKTRDEIAKAIALAGTNEKERLAKFAALKQGSNRITSVKDSLCNINGLVGWQRFLKDLHTREKKCQQMVGAAASFSEKMQATIAYLESEQMIVKIINDVPTSKAELTENDWEAQGTAWQDAANKIGKISASSNFTPTKQAAHDAAKKIDAAWQEVIAAHKATDRTRYVAAESQLISAYGALDTMASVSQQQLKKLLDPMQAAYDKAFK